jgi:serine/threonine-protein kinase
MAQHAERWQQLEAVFEGAVARPAGDRPAYLKRACGGDEDLRLELDAMLAADSPDRALPIERMVHDAEGESVPDPFVGMQLGAWRIVDPIGRGGMGTVYLAERADGQYEQQVALKVIPTQPVAADGRQRFQAERHILARLSHPHIARLLDAGFTPEGSAFLVMEYVDGTPITTYCDDRQLSVDDRLRLFRQVSNATQHAHQSLVVHRDLKPANIFVSHAGEVKLLDFGIAKLLAPEEAATEATARELRVLTPGYAAPEQFSGDPVTTATDVYALGVVLHELLAGQRPVAAASPAVGSAPAEAASPLAPSLAVRRMLASQSEADRIAIGHTAVLRRTSGRKLQSRLDGDIDRVVLKALSADPRRRYASAGQLAEEVDRLLSGRPVVAQPDTLAYRMRRFAGRHRVGVAMAAALVLLTMAFAVSAALQARAVAIERDRARSEAVRAARVTTLAADLFKLAEPAAGRGETITARDLLVQASARIEQELHGDEATQAALFDVLGRVYANLGLHDNAIAALTRALERHRRAGPRGSLAEAETRHRLADAQYVKGDYPAAEQHLGEVLAERRRLGAPAADIGATLDLLGRVYSQTHRYAQAAVTLDEALQIRRGQSGVPASELMSGLYELGLILHRTGDSQRARRLFLEAVDLSRTIAEPSRDRITALLRLAQFTSGFEGNPAGAESLYREALGIARTLYAGDHPDLSTCLMELSRGLLDLGRFSEAEPLARDAHAMSRRLYGDRHIETMMRARVLAAVLRHLRRPSEAEPLLRTALADARALFGDGSPDTLVTSRELAHVLETQGRFAEALTIRLAALEGAVRAFGDPDAYVAIELTGLGDHSRRAGRSEAAERYYRRALDVRQRLHPPGHWRIDDARLRLASALVDAGRLAEAERELLGAHDGLSASRGPAAGETLAARKQLADLYERWHRPADARRYASPPR